MTCTLLVPCPLCTNLSNVEFKVLLSWPPCISYFTKHFMNSLCQSDEFPGCSFQLSNLDLSSHRRPCSSSLGVSPFRFSSSEHLSPELVNSHTRCIDYLLLKQLQRLCPQWILRCVNFYCSFLFLPCGQVSFFCTEASHRSLGCS